MCPTTIAIQRTVYKPLLPLDKIKQVFSKAKDWIEQKRIQISMSSKLSIKQLQRIPFENIQFAKHSLDIDPNKLEKPNEKLRKEVKVLFAKTNEEAAQMIVENSDVNEEMKEDIKDEYLEKPSAGRYIKDTHVIVINAQQVKESYTIRDARLACISEIMIHEGYHHISPFERFFRTQNKRAFDLIWLIEGITERLTQITMYSMYGEQSKLLDRVSTPELVGLAMKLGKLVSEEELFRAYLQDSNFEDSLFGKLKDAGVTEDEIVKILTLGHQMTYAEEEAEKEDILKEINKQLDGFIQNKNRRRKTQEFVAKSADGPGMSAESIEAVKMRLAESQHDQAPLLVLDACLLHMLDGRELTRGQVWKTVDAAIGRNNGIVANARRDLIAQATATMQPMELASGFTISLGIPVSGSRTPDPNTTSTSVDVICTTPNPQEKFDIGESLTMSPRAELSVPFGQEITHETAMLVEAAAVDYMLKNDGQLPDAQEIEKTITSSFDQTRIQEGVTPDAGMMTTNILSSTADSVQDKSLSEADSWLREPSEAYLKKNPSAANLFEQPYSEQTKTDMAKILNATEELHGYGGIVAEHCNTFFSDIGVEPTCSEVFGLAACAVNTARELNLTRVSASEISSELSGFNPEAHATLNVLAGWRVNTWKENRQPEQRNAGEAVENAGQSKDSKKTENKKGAATQVFSTLLKMEHPEDRIECDDESTIVVMSPEGKQKKVGEASYGESIAFIGRAGGVTDPRNKGSIVTVLPHIMHTGRKTVKGKYEYEELELPQNSREIAQNIKANYDDLYGKAYAIFDILRTGGKLGIEGSMYLEDRKGGSKSVAEAIEEKTANCLELTMAYVSMAQIAFEDEEKARIFPLDVVNPNQRVEIGHACIGILIEDERVCGHPAFENNWEFRNNILSQFGIQDNSKLRLLVIDPVNNVFDYRFHRIELLDERKLMSYFHSNSAIYYKTQRKDAKAKEHYAEAERLWPSNPRVLENKAEILIHKNPEKAIEFLLGMEEGYRTSSYYYELAVAYLELDSRKRALDCLNRAISMNRNHYRALLTKAIVLMKSGNKDDVEEAKTTLLQTISVLRSRRRSTTSSQRWAARDEKKLDLAIEGATMLQTEDWLIVAFNLLALAHLMSGETVKAYDICERGLEYKPLSPSLREIKASSMAIMAFRLKEKDPGKSKKLAKEAMKMCAALCLDAPESPLPHLIEGYVANVNEKRAQQEKSFRNFGDARLEAGNPLPHEGLDRMIGLNAISPHEFLFIYAASIGFGENMVRIWQLNEDIFGQREEASIAQPPKVNISKLARKWTDYSKAVGGRVSISAMKAYVEEQKTPLELILRVQKSRLSKREKALVIGIIKAGPKRKREEIEMLVAVNHERLLVKRKKRPGRSSQAMIDFLTDHGKKTGFPRTTYVQLAKLRLEEVFDEEKRKIEEAIESDPLKIERKMLRAGVEFSRRFDLNEQEIKKMASEYLSLLGLPATERNIERVLPEIRNQAIGHSLLGKLAFFDPYISKYTE